MRVGPLELLILSAALQAAGQVLQKHRVATRAPGVPLGQVARRLGAFFRPLLWDPYWLLGGMLGLLGAMAGLQTLSMMDLSVIKTLGRIETLLVVLAGVFLLGERLRVGEGVGVMLLVSGAVLLVQRADETSGVSGTREAHGILVACVVGMLLLLVGWRRLRRSHASSELCLAVAAGFLFGMGDILTKGATEAVKSGAIDGGFSVIEPSSMVGLVQTPEFGVAVAAYVGGAILIQAAFSVGRVAVIGPATLIGAMLLPIAFALTVLQEDLTGDRLAGILTIGLGTVLLGLQPGRDHAVAAATPAGTRTTP
jgi:drug/metabolite transporter (DMT)-like permease